MRILAIVPACPAPFGDTAARWFDVAIRELVRRGHDVDLMCVTDEPAARVSEARQRLADVRGAGRFTATFHPLATTRPALARKLASARRPFSEIEQADGVRREFERRLRQGVDVLHLEQLWSGWLATGTPPALLNVHHLEVIDREHDRPAWLRERKTLWQMRRATGAILGRAANLRLFTPRLADRARTYNPGARHWILPFALDASRYEVVAPTAAPVVGMIGSMHWPPSRGAAERLVGGIWPRVRALVPEARLLVAGWNADRHLAHLAATPGLELRSDVAHPRDFFGEVAAMVYAPRRGSGMKVKVMEAMAYGVPVVTTSEGIEGLEAQAGVHAHVADDDDAIAAHVAGLLRDRAAARRMRDAARALIVERYNPRIVVDGLVDIYQELHRP